MRLKYLAEIYTMHSLHSNIRKDTWYEIAGSTSVFVKFKIRRVDKAEKEPRKETWGKTCHRW